ncbi:PREDICTED: chymotrypsin B-like [Ceratosolen solmsi marchali]|uniref:Chymotrypsin B-like n=1 Tax=Ceratosolen solmsi marchali TaxID=326594 RepID=A0AAJ6VKZ2_9HYME|nr:PREDICTED: chymotrypsin B-like [Ceratosolen solmsi marchali]
MYLVIFCLFLHSLIFCDQFDFSNAKALHGYNIQHASVNEFPFIVSIQISLQKESAPFHICTGVLVSRIHVVFAEHCLEEQQYKYSVLVVKSIKSQKRLSHATCWMITYNQWCKQKSITMQYQTNDIAIFKLAQAVDNHVNPALISNIPNNFLYGLNVTIASWDKTNYNEDSITINYGYVTVLTDSECENQCSEILGEKVTLPTIMLCTAVKPYVLLNIEDSGGPLLYNGVFIGLNAGSCPCEDAVYHPRKLNIHFSINYYKNFIIDIKENCI